MAYFDDVEITFKGETLTIPENKIMTLILELEQIGATLDALTPDKRGLIAHAYSFVINFAGGKTTPEEIYSSLFEGKQDPFSFLFGLQCLMIPPERIKELLDDDQGDGEVKKKDRPG
jgi:hypothetical protein